MTVFDLDSSIANVRKRFGNTGRMARRDRGSMRTDPEVVKRVERLLRGWERPPMRGLLEKIADECRAAGLKAPSRATAYKIMAAAPSRKYRVADLPPAVRAALYNLDDASVVPARQVAFYCFNYGDLAAVSFAAGLGWLALLQAGRLPGHRRKSRALLQAVLQARGIEDGRA